MEDGNSQQSATVRTTMLLPLRSRSPKDLRLFHLRNRPSPLLCSFRRPCLAPSHPVAPSSPLASLCWSAPPQRCFVLPSRARASTSRFLPPLRQVHRFCFRQRAKAGHRVLTPCLEALQLWKASLPVCGSLGRLPRPSQVCCALHPSRSPSYRNKTPTSSPRRHCKR